MNILSYTEALRVSATRVEWDDFRMAGLVSEVDHAIGRTLNRNPKVYTGEIVVNFRSTERPLVNVIHELLKTDVHIEQGEKILRRLSLRYATEGT